VGADLQVDLQRDVAAAVPVGADQVAVLVLAAGISGLLAEVPDEQVAEVAAEVVEPLGTPVMDAASSWRVISCLSPIAPKLNDMRFLLSVGPAAGMTAG